MNTKTKATIEDLYRVPENGKAELVDGELLIMSPTGYLPGYAGGESDYGPQAESRIAKKRADYFAAGTLVVWDVDLQSDDVVKVYRASDPNHPTIYRRGEIAEAEPAVPGWTMPVDDLFGE